MMDFDYENLLAGKLYQASEMQDKNSALPGKVLVQRINQLPLADQTGILKSEKELFGILGENSYVNPPFQVDYGRHIQIGDNFYANQDCYFLDTNQIIIGDNVMLGPRVNLFTAGHPIDPTIRNEQLEFGQVITIGNNVWIGGNSTILPGVTIGDNCVVGAASVVTKDIPANSLVVGDPARVLRQIGEKDRVYWQQQKELYWRAKQGN